MMEMLRDQPSQLQLTTRRYPVELGALQDRLSADLRRPYDAVLHLGQSPGSVSVKLEAIAVNAAGCIGEQGEELPPLVEDGPTAYRSRMPLGAWAAALRESHIPAAVSYHAGTFLCNATMYLTHHWTRNQRQHMPVGFVHLPLAMEQVASLQRSMPCLPTETLGSALRLILEQLYEWFPLRSDAHELA